MKERLCVGIIVADDGEYEAVSEFVEKYGGEEYDFYSRPGHRFEVSDGERTVEVRTVLCGIGMVNAAAAAMWLAQDCDILISTGFSGGLWGCEPGDIAAGTQYVEHDFDLCGLGYEPGEKPEQAYIYECDPLLLELFESLMPDLRSGAMVSGDRFICDDEESFRLRRQWNAIACDMETAAPAYVAYLTGKRYIAIRQISDGADDSAETDYDESQNNGLYDAAALVMDGVRAMFEIEELWS